MTTTAMAVMKSPVKTLGKGVDSFGVGAGRAGGPHATSHIPRAMQLFIQLFLSCILQHQQIIACKGLSCILLGVSANY